MANLEFGNMLDLVDSAGFVAWADKHVPRLGNGPLEIRFLTGGSTNAVYSVTRGGDLGVLRRPPRVPRPDSAKILGREARVLQALNGSGVPAPEMWGWSPDSDAIGSPFYVMSFVDGWTPNGDGPFPRPFDVAGPERRSMAFELVRGIADLARVDYEAVGLEGFGKPGNFLARQVDRWRGQLAMYRETESYAGRELPGYDYVADWLGANTPESPRIGIIHGDYGFPNTLFSRTAPCRLAAMIDWELSTIGDPLLDLGWTIQCFAPRDPNGVPPPPNLFDTSFYPSREDLAEFYHEQSGLPIDNIDYYMILAQFKLATLLERKYAESLIGKASKEYGAFFGQLTLDLLASAEQLARRAKG
ncbi:MULTISPECIES: phosphotransferase family protein [unclassified Sphingobium]|uniref:phosphotransferase family protein n=1 Tax=unclassified Sphingobium TaxID=2611147 RepID=UPI0035A72E4F